MKIKIIAAIIIAAGVITFISCNWFSVKKDPEQSFVIEGKWTIDSVEHKGSDSSAGIGLLALAMAAKDSLPLGFEFKNDSTYAYLNTRDSMGGKYYLSANTDTLYVKEDSVYQPLRFITKTDSVFSVMTADSIFFHLKKK